MYPIMEEPGCALALIDLFCAFFCCHKGRIGLYFIIALGGFSMQIHALDGPGAYDAPGAGENGT